MQLETIRHQSSLTSISKRSFAITYLDSILHFSLRTLNRVPPYSRSYHLLDSFNGWSLWPASWHRHSKRNRLWSECRKCTIRSGSCHAVNPLDAFVVPAIALHVAQIQKAQAKGPVPLVSSQPLQPVGDLFVLITQHWAVAITRLADLERATGQSTTHPMLCGGIHGHLSPQRRPQRFFPKASSNRSFCMLISAYIFLRCRFCSAMSFISAIKDASIPPNFARHL
jgi:hypothetical protein